MTWSFKLARRMASAHSRTIVSTLVLAFGLTACGNDVTGTDVDTPDTPKVVPGLLSLQLDTPSSDDGAVQFMVTGPAIDSVQAVGYTGYNSTVNTTSQLIVTGQVHDGLVARVYVKDVARASEYRVAVVAAAARNTYALQNLQGYSATLSR